MVMVQHWLPLSQVCVVDSSSFVVVVVVVLLVRVHLLVVVQPYVDDDAWDVSYTSVVPDVVHVLNQVFRDYIHDNEDEDDWAAFRIVDKVDNNFVDVVVRKQQHYFHDHMDMHLPSHNNLYFRKNHYKEFFCRENLYW